MHGKGRVEVDELDGTVLGRVHGRGIRQVWLQIHGEEVPAVDDVDHAIGFYILTENTSYTISPFHI